MLTAILSSLKLSDIFSLLLILLVTYVFQFYYRYFTRPNPLPGPLPLPLVGNSLQAGHKFTDWMLSLHKKYGDMFELVLAGKRTIIVCRADLIDSMNVPSTKSKYPIRFEMTEDFVEFGVDNIGIINNNHMQSWKFNRQFFSQSMMTPSFNHQNIQWAGELWEEMESYWNNLGEDYELDLIQWMRRFTNEMIFRIATGVKNDSVASYYKFLAKENKDDGGKFVQAIDHFIKGFLFVIVLNKFTRRYIPYFREEWKNILESRDYLFEVIYKIIEERRITIENTPLDQPLRHDMLTGFITANTPRDINPVKNADAEYLRPMTDREIFGNLLDAMIGGIDTVNFILFYLLIMFFAFKNSFFFFFKKKKSLIDGELGLLYRILSRTTS